jgi:S-DNA-T family DNA segregation ATPase FtsK/SpoIIIE
MAKRTAKKNNTPTIAAIQEPSTPSSFRKVFTAWVDGPAGKIVGVVLLLLTSFLLVSFFSYLFTWKFDQDQVFRSSSSVDFLIRSSAEVKNEAGRLGAWASHQFLYNGFGLASFFFVFFLLIWGLNLLLSRRVLPTLKTFFYTTVFTLLLSPILSFFFRKEAYSFSYGGGFGNKVVWELNRAAGEWGTLCMIIGLCLILALLFFPPLLKLPLLQASKGEPLQSTNKPEELIPVTPELPITTTPVAMELSDSDLVQPAPVYEIETAESFAAADETVDLPNEIEMEEEPEINVPAHSTSLELDDNTYSEPPIESPDSLTLEVHANENIEPIVELNEPISIAGDEPYDPSLELRNYKFPTLDLLEHRNIEEISIDKNELEQNKNQIINTLKSFGITIAKISATVGPTVTLYEIVPAEGVRISKIRNLEDDIALSLAALGIRIIAPIPGKGTIGIEVPNLKKQIVPMRSLMASEKFIHSTYSLPIALGKKIDNENYIVDLATMPHLLMAGATGQGKSVGINTILVSLLYKKHPSQLKFVLVDPKKVELSIYKMIEKHFLAKLPNEEEAIITDTKKVINTLNALCIEMDNRYDLLKEAGVRNIKEYNEKFIKRRLNPNKGHQYLPFIVLVVDEFADLIMTAGKEVEMPIARLAQLARAVGIHLIIATQRPSVNVITGTIKANFPGRVAFRVSAKVDSRTILDTGGADQLIGRGDMLILNGSELVRLQCAFVDTPEVERIVEFIGSQQGYPTAFDLPEYEGSDGGDLSGGSKKSLKEVDQMFEQCARLVVSSGSGSTSMLQRRFNLGYNRAGRIMDKLEAAGIVGATVGGKPRELLVHTETELDEIIRTLGL